MASLGLAGGSAGTGGDRTHFFVLPLEGGVRAALPKFQRFFDKWHPKLLVKNQKDKLPLEEIKERLFGKLMLSLEALWEEYATGQVDSGLLTFALMLVNKNELRKVAQGKCQPFCLIARADNAEFLYPKPPFDSKRSFLVRFEVDDPDEPLDNPSMWMALDLDQDLFFGGPGLEGMGLCEKWMIEMTRETVHSHAAKHSRHPVMVIDCAGRPASVREVPGLGRLTERLGEKCSRAFGEEIFARNGACTGCQATKVPLQKCSVCKRAYYCSRECQKKDWKAHKVVCSERYYEDLPKDKLGS